MINRVISNLSYTKFASRHVDKVVNDDIYAARLLVTSNVIKDAIVYGFRFDKSKDNEEIPADKRKFVAALDLSCGIVTSITQLLIGFAISNRKFQANICKRLFGHLEKSSPELFSLSKKGFTAAVSLIGAGVIGERVIVPLLATPLASWVEDRYIGKNIKKDQLQINKFPAFQSVHTRNIFTPFLKSTNLNAQKFNYAAGINHHLPVPPAVHYLPEKESSL